MDIEATAKSIRSVHATITGKVDADLLITYKGNGYGVSKPWRAQIDAREADHENCEGSLSELLIKLKDELANKVKSTENEAHRLRQVLNQLGN